MREKAVDIIETLKSKGHVAAFVGGPVRDTLLGRPVNDYDIATCALPSQVKEYFPHHIADGEDHGCVKIIVDGYVFDVATLREDGVYEDGRRPQTVTYTDSFALDSIRRDFTVNSLYMTVEGTIMDFHNGQDDIEAKVLRCVGSPSHRFEEDKLRILRAARFAGQLGFELDALAFNAAKRFASQLSQIAQERITIEFYKILNLPEQGFLESFALLEQLGILDQILPEITSLKGVTQDCIHHPGDDQDVYVHSVGVMKAVKAQNADADTVFAGLLHDIAKKVCREVYIDKEDRERVRNYNHAEVGAEMAKEVCLRFKLAGWQVGKIAELVRLHMRAHSGDQLSKAKLIEFLRNPYIESIVQLQHADGVNSAYADKTLKGFYTEKLATLNLAISAPLLISGRDIIEAGVAPSAMFGPALSHVRQLQDAGTVTTKEQALTAAVVFLNGSVPSAK